MSRFVVIFFVICATNGFFGELAAQPLPGISEKDFLHPPLEARPGALWPWLNGYADKAQISKELSEMKAKGMRGGIIWDLGSLADPEKIIPSGPAFLGKESLDAIHHAIDESSRLGLELGLVASSSWNAGGSWVQPRDGSKVLLWSETKLTGPQFFNDTLALPLKTNAYYSDVVILAIPDDKDSMPADPGNIQNITRFFHSGKLKWDVPKGKWNIMRFVNSNTGQLLMCPSPNSNGLMIDHLSADAVDDHLNFMLNRLKEGRKDLGSLKYFFFDSYELDEGTDWTANFLHGFSDIYGYDATIYLPTLSGKIIGSKELTARFKHDYHKAVSDFIIENHFRTGNKLLNKNGIKLIAEAGHGGSARVDVLKAMGAVDIPMGEFWNHQRFWVTKEAASAAHIYGKKLVPAESLTGWQHWKQGPSEYKRLVDIAFCAGLNQVTFHTFTHNPPGAGLPGFAYHAGEHFNVNTTWWNVSKPMLDYFSRCSYMLQQGEFVADVCFYYGDQAPNLVPSRRIDPSVKPIYDSSTCLHCGRPRPVHVESLGPGYDYDYVNEEVILTRMHGITGGVELSHGMKYRVLVLPDHDEISLEVMRKLEKLIKDGAIVVGRKPTRSNSLKNYPACDEEVKAIAERIWGSCNGETIKESNYGKGKVIWNIPLNEVLASLKVTPDFTVENVLNKDQHIDYIHRRTASEDYYFVSNSADFTEEVSCLFRAGKDYSPMLWNPEDGSVSRIYDFERVAGHVRVVLKMPPASSVFIVFKKEKAPGMPVVIKQVSGNILPVDYREAVLRNAEIIGDNRNMYSARVWSPGTYRVTNSKGTGRTIKTESVFPEIHFDSAWKLMFPAGWGAPELTVMDTLYSWPDSPDPGIKYFSGTAAYLNTFTVAENKLTKENTVFLNLGKMKEVAEVFLNGKRVGVIWKSPFQIDITPYIQPGINNLKINVTNLWNNRLTGDKQPGVIPYTRTNMQRGFSADTPLIGSGLLGPVKIITAKNISFTLE